MHDITVVNIRRNSGKGLAAKRNLQNFSSIYEHGAATNILLGYKQNSFGHFVPTAKGHQIFCTLSKKLGQRAIKKRSDLANGTFAVFFFLANANGPSVDLYR